MKQAIAEVWQFISANALPIIGLIVAAITALGVFLGPRLAAKWQREKERRDADLRAHFKDLERSIAGPLRRWDDPEWGRGWDVLPGRIRHVGYLILEMGELSTTFPFDENSVDFEAFEAHFPDEANEWKDFRNKANRHIATHNNFVKVVKKALEEKLRPIRILDEAPEVATEYADIRILSLLWKSWVGASGDYDIRFEVKEASNKP